MIFLTVGTQFPFDRLVKAVDELVGKNGVDKVYGQIGKSSYQPVNFESVASLEKHLFDKRLRESTGIISHAGMGIIAMAMEYNKPLLVMPRLSKYGEVVNDHQVDIAEKFEALGHLLVTYTADQLPDRIKQLQTFIPKSRKADPQKVAARIADFINSISQ